VGVNHRTVRTDWVKNRDFSPLPAKAWKETLRDALDDIPCLIRRKRIAIPLNTKADLHGMLRVIIKDGVVEVHYLANNHKHASCGTEVIGVDKGYSEVFADSEAEFHGEGFSKLLTPISNARTEKNKNVTN